MIRLKQYIENFMKYRFLLRELVINDIKIKYKRSILGMIWSVLHPLMMMIVLSVVFSALFKSDIPFFPVYVLTGRIIWDLYATSSTFAMGAITGSGQLIKKVYVPKYIFPLSKCLSTLVNTGLSLIALFLVMIIMKVEITPAILFLPLPLLYTFLFSTGVGMLLSAYTVFFRDLNYLYEVLLTAWIYLTPLFYPANILPDELQYLLKVNPMYYLVENFRDIVMYGNVPDVGQSMICFAIGIIFFVIGVVVFYRKQDEFILYI